MMLRALVGSPELRLRVLAGGDALDRPVTGVFTTDLADPRRYLSGGELVLTGLMWWRSPRDSERFADALAQAGVAALAAGDAALGSVPADLVAACRRHGLPLLEVPVDISFAAITERVLASLPGTGLPETGAPGSAVRGGRRLPRLPGAGDPRPPRAAVEAAFALAAEYQLAGWLAGPAGRLVAGRPPAGGERLLAALAAGYLTAAAFPAVVTADGAAYTLHRVSGRPAHRLAGWFAAFAGDHQDWDGDRRALAAGLTELAAAHRAQHEAERRPAGEAAAELLRLAGAGPAPRGQPRQDAVTATLRRCGIGPGEPVAVVTALLSGPAEPEQVASALLAELLPGAAAAACGTGAVAFASGGRVPGRVRAAAAPLAPGLAQAGLAIGVSVPSDGQAGTDGLVRALDEARQACRLAELRGGGTPGGAQVVDGGQLGSQELLLSLLPGEARRGFTDRLLGPVAAYDRERGTALLPTLEVFLDCSGSWTKAAGLMFIHVNSLRYRIRRIEELTGRDLGTLAGQADLLLALRLRRSAAEDQRPDPLRRSRVQPGHPARE